MAQGKRVLKVGVIGCGEVAEKFHMPALLRLPRVKVVAVADADVNRVRHMAYRFRIERHCRDYHELLRIPDMDIAAILVPTAWHTEVAVAALDAGMHLFIEKPQALSMDDIDRLIAQSEGSSRKVMVGFNLRWHRLVLRARDIVSAGMLGRIHGVRTILTSGSANRQRFSLWRKHRILGGGVLIDMAVHHFDLLRFLLRKEIEEVYAASHSDQRDDISAVVTAKMEGDVVVNSFFSECTTNRNEIEIYGERGSLHVSCHRFDGLAWYPFPAYPDAIGTRLKQALQTLKELPGGFLRTHRGGDYWASFYNEWRHFVEAVRYDKPVAYQPVEGRQTMLAVFAAIQSATLGKPVKLADAPRNVFMIGVNEGDIDNKDNQNLTISPYGFRKESSSIGDSFNSGAED